MSILIVVDFPAPFGPRADHFTRFDGQRNTINGPVGDRLGGEQIANAREGTLDPDRSGEFLDQTIGQDEGHHGKVSKRPHLSKRFRRQLPFSSPH
ncbi:MAG: hypothetical protein L0G99_12205 [Propionibacteriales bacterium]|nr:hypothetical protein [Propionibacteriales bacterium]